MDSLQFSADVGASEVLDQVIGLCVQLGEIILELVDRVLPGARPLILNNASGMAAWFEKKRKNISESEPNSHFKIKPE